MKHLLALACPKLSFLWCTTAQVPSFAWNYFIVNYDVQKFVNDRDNMKNSTLVALCEMKHMNCIDLALPTTFMSDVKYRFNESLFEGTVSYDMI